MYGGTLGVALRMKPAPSVGPALNGVALFMKEGSMYAPKSPTAYWLSLRRFSGSVGKFTSLQGCLKSEQKHENFEGREKSHFCKAKIQLVRNLTRRQ